MVHADRKAAGGESLCVRPRIANKRERGVPILKGRCALKRMYKVLWPCMHVYMLCTTVAICIVHVCGLFTPLFVHSCCLHLCIFVVCLQLGLQLLSAVCMFVVLFTVAVCILCIFVVCLHLCLQLCLFVYSCCRLTRVPSATCLSARTRPSWPPARGTRRCGSGTSFSTRGTRRSSCTPQTVGMVGGAGG